MAKLTTTAWVAHELGLAASFGGLLFGKLALNPNLKFVTSKPERGKLLNKSWNRYNVVNVIAFGTAAATWLAGRATISGRSIDDDAQNLVRVKDGLFIVGALTGLASIISGLRLTRKAPDGAVPIETGTTPASETPEEAAGLLRTVNVLGNVNLGIVGSILGVSTVLSMKANQSTRWSAVSRFLP